MKLKTLRPIGSLQPILFFAVVYIVALVLSIFVCSTLFYSCNANSSVGSIESTPENITQTEVPAALASIK